MIDFCDDSSNVKDGTRYDWSQKLQGIILSSFYWGYITTQIPGGILSQRFGGKHVLTTGLVFTAICTLVTPVAVQYGILKNFSCQVFRFDNGLFSFCRIVDRWRDRVDHITRADGHRRGHYVLIADGPPVGVDSHRRANNLGLLCIWRCDGS